MSGIDLNRGTTGVVLPKEVSAEIWSETQEASAVMALSRQITLPGSGVTIPVITGDAEAGWVAETDEAPVSEATLDSKDVQGYKLSVIELFSNEFKRDLKGLYAELARRLPNAIAKKFDQTVFGTTAPGSNFDTLGGATAVKLAPNGTDVKKGSYAGLVEAYTSVAGNSGELSGWALSSAAKGLLLGQVDTTGRPLLADSIAAGSTVPALLGEPVYYSKGVYAAGTPATIGFAGDWSSAVYGVVEGINLVASSEATIINGTIPVTSGEVTVNVPNVISLLQRDMFALKVTAEIGFRVRDVNRFVKLTDATR